MEKFNIDRNTMKISRFEIKKIVASLFMLLVFALSGFAADFTWTGKGEDGLWTNPANWDVGSGYPDSDDKAIINGGTVSIDSNITLRQIEFSGDVTLSFSNGAVLTVDYEPELFGGTGLDVFKVTNETSNLTLTGSGEFALKYHVYMTSENDKDIFFDNLTVDKGVTFSITQDKGAFGDNAHYGKVIYLNFFVNDFINDGTLTLQDTRTNRNNELSVYFYGNFTNNGTFNVTDHHIYMKGIVTSTGTIDYTAKSHINNFYGYVYDTNGNINLAKGNLGTLNINSGTITFDSSNGSELNVENLNLGSGATLTLNSDINIKESWNDEGGTFTHNSHAVDFSSATGDENGVISINGATSFYDLKAEGLGGKTLSFGEACNITVTHEMTLSGTDVENPLTVTGAGSGTENRTITLPDRQYLGNYLNVETTVPKIIDSSTSGIGKYISLNSTPELDTTEEKNLRTKGWYVFGNQIVHRWIGGTESGTGTGIYNINEKSNWEFGEVPEEKSYVQIQSSTSYPATWNENINFAEIKIDDGNTLILDLNVDFSNITLINNGTLDINNKSFTFNSYETTDDNSLLKVNDGTLNYTGTNGKIFNTTQLVKIEGSCTFEGNEFDIQSITYVDTPDINCKGRGIKLPNGSIGNLNVLGPLSFKYNDMEPLKIENVVLETGAMFSANSDITISGDWTDNTQDGYNIDNDVYFRGDIYNTIVGKTNFTSLNFEGCKTVSINGDITVDERLSFNGNGSDELLTITSDVTSHVLNFSENVTGSANYVNVTERAPTIKVGENIGEYYCFNSEPTDSAAVTTLAARGWIISTYPQQYTWTGKTETDGIYKWSEASNWDGRIVPPGELKNVSVVTIPTGLTNYPTVDTQAYAGTLRLENLSVSVDISGTEDLYIGSYLENLGNINIKNLGNINMSEDVVQKSRMGIFAYYDGTTVKNFVSDESILDYNNLVFESGTVTVTGSTESILANNITIKENVTLDLQNPIYPLVSWTGDVTGGGTPGIVNNYAVDFSKATGNGIGVISINGATSFYDLKATGLGGKTLSFGEACNITVTKDMTLSGTDVENPLTVTGAENGTITLPDRQNLGNYLNVETTVPNIIDSSTSGIGKYISLNSSSEINTDDLETLRNKGWYVFGEYIICRWIGGVDSGTDIKYKWSESANWELGEVPGENSYVYISNRGDAYPYVDSDIFIGAMEFEDGAKIQLYDFEITLNKDDSIPGSTGAWINSNETNVIYLEGSNNKINISEDAECVEEGDWRFYGAEIQSAKEIFGREIKFNRVCFHDLSSTEVTLHDGFVARSYGIVSKDMSLQCLKNDGSAGTATFERNLISNYNNFSELKILAGNFIVKDFMGDTDDYMFGDLTVGGNVNIKSFEENSMTIDANKFIINESGNLTLETKGVTFNSTFTNDGFVTLAAGDVTVNNTFTNNGTVKITGEGNFNKTDNDSGTFIYFNGTTVKDFESNDVLDYNNLVFESKIENGIVTGSAESILANNITIKENVTLDLQNPIYPMVSWTGDVTNGGTPGIVNSHAVDFSKTTGNGIGVISINGSTTFYDLKATGLGGKTLIFGEACNITVTNEMTLSGTDVENPLTVKGTKGGTINVVQNNIGNYLTLVSENLPTITNVNSGSEKLFEICLYSSSDLNEAAKEKNWLVFAGEMIFTWVGGTESDVDDGKYYWTDNANWDNGIHPTYISNIKPEVVIPDVNTAGYPTVNELVENIFSLKIEENASIYFTENNLVLSSDRSFDNVGKIIYQGVGRLQKNTGDSIVPTNDDNSGKVIYDYEPATDANVIDEIQFYDLEIAKGEWVWKNNSGNGDVEHSFVNNSVISFVNDATFTSLFTNNGTININNAFEFYNYIESENSIINLLGDECELNYKGSNPLEFLNTQINFNNNVILTSENTELTFVKVDYNSESFSIKTNGNIILPNGTINHLIINSGATTFNSENAAELIIRKLELKNGTTFNINSDINILESWNDEGGTLTHNNYAVDFSSATGDVNDIITINGATSFYDLKATGLGGKTLSFGEACNITVTNEMTLSGTDAENPLTVKGTKGGTINVVQNNIGNYLTLESENLPTITNVNAGSEKLFEICLYSSSDLNETAKEKNWLVFAGEMIFTWVGGSESDVDDGKYYWTDNANWDNGIHPTYISNIKPEVVIPSENTNGYPTVNELVENIFSLKIEENASLYFTENNLVLSSDGSFDNVGKIIYQGVGRLQKNIEGSVVLENDSDSGKVIYDYEPTADDNVIDEIQFYDLEIKQGEWVWKNNSGNGDVENSFVNNSVISFVNDATFTSLFTNNGTININNAFEFYNYNESENSIINLLGDECELNYKGSNPLEFSNTQINFNNNVVLTSENTELTFVKVDYNSESFSIKTNGNIILPNGTINHLIINSGATTFNSENAAELIIRKLELKNGTTFNINSDINILESWNDEGGTLTHNNYTVDFSNATGDVNDIITINGVTSFYDLKATGLGGKTLSFGEACNITVTNEMTLSGTDVENPLTVKGTKGGTINVVQNNIGNYLKLMSENLPTITNVNAGSEKLFEICLYSSSDSDETAKEKNWLVFAGEMIFIWVGGSESDVDDGKYYWTDNANWDNGIHPTYISDIKPEVVIPDVNTAGYPTVNELVENIFSLIIEENASLYFTDNNLVLSSVGTLENLGTLIYQGVGRLQKNIEGSVVLENDSDSGKVIYDYEPATDADVIDEIQFYDLEIAQGEWVWKNNSGNGDVGNSFVNNSVISFVNDTTFTSLFTNNGTINIYNAFEFYNYNESENSIINLLGDECELNYKGSNPLEFSNTQINFNNNVVLTSENTELTFVKVDYNSESFSIKTNGNIILPNDTINHLIINSGATTFNSENAAELIIRKLELKNGTTFNINSDINILESWNDEGGTLTHNNYAVDFSSATGDVNDIITINGSTSFYDLKATGLAGKTLSFGEACNITVTNEMTLSGTDVENPLKVKGTKGGAINVVQNNIGNYLKLDSENLPIIKNIDTSSSEKLFEICLYSSSDLNEAAKEKNWLVFAGEMIFTWVGGSESDVDDGKYYWTDNANWDNGIHPTYISNIKPEVVIPDENTAGYPTVNELVENIYSLKIEENASLYFTEYNLVLSSDRSFDNVGKIIYQGVGRLQKNIEGSVVLENDSDSGKVIYDYEPATDANVIDEIQFYDLEIAQGEWVWATNDLILNDFVNNGMIYLQNGNVTLNNLINNEKIYFSNGNVIVNNIFENIGEIHIRGTEGTGNLNKNDTDSGSFIYYDGTTVKDFESDESIPDYNKLVFESGVLNLDGNYLTRSLSYNNISTTTLNTKGYIKTMDSNLKLSEINVLGNTIFEAIDYISVLYSVKTVDNNETKFINDVFVMQDNNSVIGGGVGRICFEKNIYITNPANIVLSINSPLVVKENFVLLNGVLSFVGNGKSLDVEKDVLLLNGSASTMFKDNETGVIDLFAYHNEKRIQNVNLLSLPETLPNGTSIDTSIFTGSFDCDNLEGLTLNVGKNFYANGVNFSARGNWNINIPSNDSNLNTFAEAYNCEFAYCNVTSDLNEDAFIAAAENCIDNGNNNNVQFERTKILNAWTVYDDVVYVEFDVEIENTNNEISNALKNIKTNNGGFAFTGSFVDKDCSDTTDDKGDLKSFYLVTDGSEVQRWNTDATGSSAGDISSETKSTDRGRKNQEAATRNIVPNIDIPKATSELYDVLRDKFKNRLKHYHGESRYNEVSDKCSPVLIEVRTGQELHNENDISGSQKKYDAHNFIQLRYSEDVIFGNESFEEKTLAENIQSSDNYNGEDNFGGALKNKNNGLTIYGFIDIENGNINLDSRNSEIGSENINALYREFAESGKNSDIQYQKKMIRISVAGYVDESNPILHNEIGLNFNNYPGYIEGGLTPDGNISIYDNSFIKDANGNQFTNGDTAGERHKLYQLSVKKNILNGKVYGPWDLQPPAFAKYLSKDNWKNIESELNSTHNEILGVDTDLDTRINVFEFHVFDNEPEYKSNDAYKWHSKNGWLSNELNDTIPAKDNIGGSRDFLSSEKNITENNQTTGGIRFSSLYNSLNAFTYKNLTKNYDESEKEFNTNYYNQSVSINSFFGEKNSAKTTDSLYLSLKLLDEDSGLFPLRNQFEVLYNPENQGYITDLAGNRMKKQNLISIDRTPPEFLLTIAPVGENKIHVVFTKEIRFQMDETENYAQNIPTQLEIINKDGTLSDLQIDTSIQAELFQNTDLSSEIILTTNRNIKLDDICNLYLRVKQPDELETDEYTGLLVYKTKIYDTSSEKNYMDALKAHALSDFGVNVIDVAYGYDHEVDGTIDDSIMHSVTSGKNFTLRDFTGNSKTNGRMLSDKDISLVTTTPVESEGLTDDGTGNIKMHIDISENISINERSSRYNEILDSNSRIWLPTELLSIAPEANSGGEILLSNTTESENFEQVEDRIYTIPNASSREENRYGYKAGDEVEFLFQYDGVEIDHDFDESTPAIPLYLLRKVDKENPAETRNSIFDLWSFKIADLQKQRGGTTILNNVINSSEGEETVLEVNLPSAGRLTISVLTLDGEVITYLERGNVESGLHYYKWNGTNENGRPVARGMYFIRIVGPNIDETRKVMVVK